MKNIFWLACFILTGCTSAPSLKEIEASKPEAYKTAAGKIPESCGAMPPVPVDIAVPLIYKAGSNSVIDPQRLKAYKQATADFNSFNIKLSTLSNNYLRTGNVHDGKCAVDFIDQWARNNALLGAMKDVNNKDQSHFHQKWELAATSTAYFQVMELATPEQDARIKWWMSQVVRPVKAFWDSSAKRNNHYVWSGVAVMQVGVITDNEDDIKWGKKTFDAIIDDVRRDGYLAYELARGAKSAHYMHFTIQPMVYMAELSRMRGEDWWNNDKLQLLVNTMLESTLDISRIDRITGIKQDLPLATDWTWFAMLRDDDPRKAKLKKFMPTQLVAPDGEIPFIMTKIPPNRYLGGDLDLVRKMFEKRKPGGTS